MAPKIAIVYYSTYGHIRTLAQAVQKGVAAAGGKADLFQLAETLSPELLTAIHAPPKSDDPIIKPEQFADYDAFLFGIPTRFGNQPSQWRAFWDSTGGLWQTAALYHKYAGLFVSTASIGGGQEATAINSLSTLAHHGMIYVPLGFAKTHDQLTNLSEIHGGSAWGAGTLASGDGSRQPTELELEVATIQGQEFYEVVSKAFS